MQNCCHEKADEYVTFQRSFYIDVLTYVSVGTEILLQLEVSSQAKMINSPLVNIVDTRQKFQLETNGNECPFSTCIHLMKKHLQNQLIDLFYFLHLIPMMVTLIISISLILKVKINFKEIL